MTESRYELAHADPATLRVNPSNVRKRRDPDEDRRLVESVARLGVLQPPGVLPDGLTVWGNRRVWAATEAKLKTIPVVRLKQPLSETEFLLHQFAENDVRSDLTDPEVYLVCTALREKNPGMTNAELAGLVHRDASMLTRIFAVDRLVPAAREAFLSGAFGFSIAYEIGKAESEQEQHRLLAERLGGSSRAALARSPRVTRRTRSDEAVKASKLRIAMGEGVVVSIHGPGLTLRTAADHFLRAGKKAEKASTEGLNIRTFEQMCKDRSQLPKAGG
jgi:ParB-like chromosome segregation protein Spo0J